MNKVYIITNNKSGTVYFGITKSSLTKRFNDHKSSARRGTKTKLYDAIRSYGEDTFTIELFEEYEDRHLCENREVELIAQARADNIPIYNLADGGDGGFVVQDIDAWKAKLRLAREGGKPALGMKHTDENKKLFSEVSKKYWATQDTFTDKEDLIVDWGLEHGFRSALKEFSISQTHYYRLRKKVLTRREQE